MRYVVWMPLFIELAVGGVATSWQERLDAARHAYSLELVDGLIVEFATEDPAPAPAALAEAYLIKAELLRFEWETLPEDAVERDHVADELDAAAKAGLEHCELLSPSSESFRLRADLLGTLIRSRYRAKRHRDDMEAAAEQAIALDPENARAYVSKAKPLLFASERHGGDIEVALELLDKALRLDHTLETASLLRAFGLEELEQHNAALAAYREILQHNPQCRPAAHAISELEQ